MKNFEIFSQVDEIQAHKEKKKAEEMRLKDKPDFSGTLSPIHRERMMEFDRGM